jgi:uncharacterized protein YbjT (DUF2867 family)
MIFVAGATGAVGQVFVQQAEAAGLPVRPHVRPGSEAKLDHPERVVLPLDGDALVDAMTGCDTVVQLIGTMRKRFHTGDTYETSDIGTTRSLVAAAQATDVQHLVLLSSVGAGRPTGPYLQAKAAAEALVTSSGIPYTILRPSAFEDREGQWMPGVRSMTRWLGLKRYEPIRLDELATALVHAVQRGPLGVIEGSSLWDAVGGP